MNKTPKLFMPMVPPPDATQGDSNTFYSQVLVAPAAATIGAPSAGTGMQITVSNPAATWPDGDYGSGLKHSTVFAMAGGYITFYPSAMTVPTPVPANGAPMTVLPEMSALTQDFGSVALHVWLANYGALNATLKDDEATNTHPVRTTHVVYSGLTKASVRAAVENAVAFLPRQEMVKSWQSNGGTGTPPADPTLRDLFADRVMAGDAAVFVKAGYVIGEAVTVTDPGSGASVARMVLKTWFNSTQGGVAQMTDPQDALDAIADLDDQNSDNPYVGHPLAGGDLPDFVHFESKFMIFNNVTADYDVLENMEVRLLKGKDEQLVATWTTDQDGYVDGQVLLKRRDLIRFEAVLPAGFQVGNRTFTQNLKTRLEHVRDRIDSNGVNEDTYRFKYRVGTAYRAFYEQLQTTRKTEKFGEDRGNAEKADWPALQSGYPRDLLRMIDEFEDYYEGGGRNADTFNMLYEGDSWLCYPVKAARNLRVLRPSDADISIFTNLDQSVLGRFQASARSYRRVPLQHSGDRSDQMFGNPTGSSAPTQWDFTQDFLKEYRFDLVFLSAGGNDFAEPGFSNIVPGPWLGGGGADAPGDSDTFPQAYAPNDRLFRPLLMLAHYSSQAPMMRLKIESSLAILLKNHPWSCFTNSMTQLSADDMSFTLDGILASSQLDLNGLIANIDGGSISALVAAAAIDITQRFPATDLSFPGATNTIYSQLMAAVFDETRMQQRYDDVRTNIERFLAALPATTKVLTHTYCYPLGQEHATALGWNPDGLRKGYYIAGPWLAPRFAEANIVRRYTKMVCLKGLIDNHVRLVLDPLKASHPNFDYVDLREFSLTPDVWNDEMHLTEDGFTVIANYIFQCATTAPLNLIP